MTTFQREELEGHVVVWIARISQVIDSLASLDRCLDPQDRARAARFHFVEDRARFTLGRALIRQSVGAYLDLEPEAIELSYTDLDQPGLKNDANLHFSISHSHELVAVVLTAHARVGLDVEWMQTNSDLDDLANRIMSATEIETFQKLPPAEKCDAFFRVWTRKEAYLKALGEGISEGLQEISVSLDAGEISSVEDTRDRTSSPAWRLQSLPVPPEYQACLACDNPNKSLQFNWVSVDKGEVVPARGHNSPFD
jgi:4'-phosphopantetheinyl transferase